MNRGGRVAGLIASSALAVIALTACGVPLDDAARPIAGYRSPKPATSAPAQTQSGTRVVVWYVSGDALVSTTSNDPMPATPEGLLALLAAPPTESQWRTLVADPQGGAPLASVTTTSPTPSPSTPPAAPPVTVQLTDTFSKLAPADQVLLIGQIVLTLTEGNDTPTRFTDSTGAPVAVPLPDGRLEAGPVTRLDYLPLTTPAPSPTS